MPFLEEYDIKRESLLKDIYTLEDFYDENTRLNAILGMTLASSDTAKFVLRLLYLLYGRFEDPMSMSQKELIHKLNDVSFRNWFGMFVRGGKAPLHSIEQRNIASRFLNVRGYYARSVFDHDPRMYYMVLRMYVLVFFSPQK
jgi:hypothetical protein